MENQGKFKLVSSDISFVQDEETVLKYWDDIKAFETSLKLSEGRPEFTFYDGPPFATGLPHYGHILAGTIKDVVTRYAHQTGHYVSRRFGWDTHGLPVEYEIDKKLKVTSPDDVYKMGIDVYNEECRSIVMKFSSEWRHVVHRMGRWIDFENDYKTLDTPFMESVWWVFSELYRKGYVYEGFKVMPFSTGCHTPLSNFEAGQNYKDVQDPAVIVSFPMVEDPSVEFIAWTTTPWTLPSNLALCVNPTLTYVKVKDMKRNKTFIMAESRLCALYKSAKKSDSKKDGEDGAPKKKSKKKKNKKAGKQLFSGDGVKILEKENESKQEETKEEEGPEFEILEKYVGSDLEGKEYVPLFPYFAHMAKTGAFKVLADAYVTDSDGTGIVHNAPGHGEDDYRVCLAGGVIHRGEAIVCPVNAAGRFTEEVTDFKGEYIKDADRKIINRLKTEGRMIDDSQCTHSYPHCWRSNTPLVQKAVPSWFVNVPSIKEKLLANNEKTYWVPSFVKEKRFHNWLADATDWSVSRDRFWGTPIPIWRSDDGEEIVVIGSIAELEEKSGVTGITDLHRHNIDHITIPSARGEEFGVLKRITQVFDCWFESGSMPYAQLHYPFENKERFENGFPADFIAEGLDQTRGWFYTLMVLSTALFDKPAFKNLIVNGLILTSDGHKMSKSKLNYDPPLEVVNDFGADAVRLYLINSPVVRAEPLKFYTAGVRDVVKTIFIPWQNTYRLFCEQARRHELKDGVAFVYRSDIHAVTNNSMDRWVLASLQSLIKLVHEEMKAYHLYTVVPALVGFISQLSNWYVRLNKNRLKGLVSQEDTTNSLSTLFEVLYQLCRLMSPFTPFLVESMYQNLKSALPEDQQEDSVHFMMLPEVNESAVDQDIERAVSRMQAVVELGRVTREKTTLGWRTPSPLFKVVHSDPEYIKDLESLKVYIQEEMNVHEVELSTDVLSVGLYKGEPNYKSLGQRLRKESGPVCKLIRKLSHDQLVELDTKGEITLDDGKNTPLYKEDVAMTWEFVGDKDRFEVQANTELGFMVLLQKQLNQECIEEAQVRDVIGHVQRMRKSAGLITEDVVMVHMECGDEAMKTMLSSDKWSAYMRTKLEFCMEGPGDKAVVASEDVTIGESSTVKLSLVKTE